mmetsp:Transcript_145662/g.254170  ORF Transcript_145662/g.254170 Transcript_145662/m.254170 type:complete len:126 (+) Transcript_145662:285-662(+)
MPSVWPTDTVTLPAAEPEIELSGDGPGEGTGDGTRDGTNVANVVKDPLGARTVGKLSCPASLTAVQSSAEAKPEPGLLVNTTAVAGFTACGPTATTEGILVRSEGTLVSSEWALVTSELILLTSD